MAWSQLSLDLAANARKKGSKDKKKRKKKWKKTIRGLHSFLSQMLPGLGDSSIVK